MMVLRLYQTIGRALFSCDCCVTLIDLWLLCYVDWPVIAEFCCFTCDCCVMLFDLSLLCYVDWPVIVVLCCLTCDCCVMLFVLWLQSSVIWPVTAVLCCLTCDCCVMMFDQWLQSCVMMFDQWLQSCVVCPLIAVLCSLTCDCLVVLFDMLPCCAVWPHVTPGISNRDQDVIIIIIITVVKSLMIYTPSRQLRSSGDYRILCVLSVKAKTFDQRSFSYAGPLIWRRKKNFHIRSGLHNQKHHSIIQASPQNPSA